MLYGYTNGVIFLANALTLWSWVKRTIKLSKTCTRPTPPQGMCISNHSLYPTCTWYKWEFWHGSGISAPVQFYVQVSVSQAHKSVTSTRQLLEMRAALPHEASVWVACSIDRPLFFRMTWSTVYSRIGIYLRSLFLEVVLISYHIWDGASLRRFGQHFPCYAGDFFKSMFSSKFSSQKHVLLMSGVLAQIL
jgi:hypothetical protein